MKELIYHMIALRVAVAKENWTAAREFSRRCLGLGYGEYRVQQTNTITIAQEYNVLLHRAQPFVNFMNELSDPEVRKDRFDELMGKLTEKYAGDVPNNINRAYIDLRDGDINQFLCTNWNNREDHPYYKYLSTFNPDIAIALMTNGLLGLFHASYNEAFFGDINRSDDYVDSNIAVEIESSTNSFKRLLKHAQTELYTALYNHKPQEECAILAEDLAKNIELYLVPFSSLQARANIATRVLRRQGSGSEACHLGKLALEAGVLTREALACHSASYSLAFALHSPLANKKIQSLIEIPHQVTFDYNLPASRHVEIDQISATPDGEMVSIEGFVVALQVIRSRDGKLLSRIELIDPSSEARCCGATIYTHLPHIGVTKGAYCRLEGAFHVRSRLFDDTPLVEVKRLSLSQIRKRSWKVNFISSAEPWYRMLPNGISMSWSVGPQRRARLSGETTYYGAGELLYPPLVRK